MVKRRKIKAIIAKRCRNKGGISLSSKKEKNYNSDTIDNTDLDQTKSKYRVPRLNGGKATSYYIVKLKAALYSHSKVNASL